jgi:membrane-associated phospholipid phosphatase
MVKYLIYDWLGLNQKLFTYLNNITNLGIAPYWLNIMSNFFDIFVFSLYFILTFIYKIYYLRGDNFDYQKYIANFKQLIQVGFIYACIGIIYTLMKYGINLPRPYCSLEHFSSISNFANVRCLSSFPSAHTAVAFMISYLFFPYLNFFGRIMTCLMVLAVGLSRIALAMHYPADIVYSIAIAYIICKTVDKILSIRSVQNNIITRGLNIVFKIFISKLLKRL